MTTSEEREAAFQRYLESSIPHFEVVEANGDTPWFHDPERLAKLGITTDDPMEARRELFMRRYDKPAPPKGLSPIHSIKTLGVAA